MSIEPGIIFSVLQIETFDNQTPVFYLSIRQQSKDLKYLILSPGSPRLQGKQIFTI